MFLMLVSHYVLFDQFIFKCSIVSPSQLNCVSFFEFCNRLSGLLHKNLQHHSPSLWPCRFPASTGTIPVEWKNVHTVADPGFPRGGTNLWHDFSQKLHEDCELETSSQSLETVLAVSGLVNMSTIHKAASSLVTGHFQNAATRIAPRDHSPINGFRDIFPVDSGMME